MNVSRKSPGSIRHARSRRICPYHPDEDTYRRGVPTVVVMTVLKSREVDSRITQIYADLVSWKR